MKDKLVENEYICIHIFFWDVTSFNPQKIMRLNFLLPLHLTSLIFASLKIETVLNALKI